MTLPIRGVAHPAPPRSGKRTSPADLSRAEIRGTQLAGKPLLNEHDSTERVGTVLASWEGRDGSLRIAAEVEDPMAIEQVKRGALRGLSLGTDMILDTDGNVAYRGQSELSVCAEGKRPGTWIDHVGGRQVHHLVCASKRAEGAPRLASLAYPPPTPHWVKAPDTRATPPHQPVPTKTMADPVVAETTVAPTEAAHTDLVARLRAELAEKTEQMTAANARASVYEGKERERIAAWQPEAEYFMREFVNDEIDNYHQGTSLKADVAPLGVWAQEYTNKPDLASQGALAAVSYVASKGIKRLRDQASANASAAETLANTMKQNEELTEKNSKLQRDYDDALAIMEERQKGLETLQAELSRAGLMQEKFEFSKISSREANPPPVAAVSAPPAALETVKAEASKAAQGSAAKANPLEGDLMASLLARSTGGLRYTHSNTNHSWVGAPSGEPDLASVLRASKGF